MMMARKNQGRYGHRGCFCCYMEAPRRTVRAREKRAWKAMR